LAVDGSERSASSRGRFAFGETCLGEERNLLLLPVIEPQFVSQHLA
jgi:hypothetical protein